MSNQSPHEEPEPADNFIDLPAISVQEAADSFINIGEPEDAVITIAEQDDAVGVPDADEGQVEDYGAINIPVMDAPPAEAIDFGQLAQLQQVFG